MPTPDDLRRTVETAAESAPGLADLVPAQRRLVAAAATGGGAPVPLEVLAELAGVSVTSSNITVGLRRLVERGLLVADGHSYAATPAAMPQAAARSEAEGNR